MIQISEKKLWKNKDYRPLIKDILFQSNIILLGLDEAETLFETNKEDEILDILLSKDNIQYVAIKNGAKGAWVATKNKTGFIPPYPCSPVDPIGAGDAFNAAFLSGILEEKIFFYVDKWQPLREPLPLKPMEMSKDSQQKKS